MKKTIEEKYTAMSEIEHVLSRPTMYIGSMSDEDGQFFIYNHEAKSR